MLKTQRLKFEHQTPKHYIKHSNLNNEHNPNIEHENLKPYIEHRNPNHNIEHKTSNPSIEHKNP